MITASVCTKQISRWFSTAITGKSIPGLYVYPDFLHTEQQYELQKQALHLHRMLLNNVTDSKVQRCTTFLSKYHNLKSNEYYRRVEIDDPSGKKIRCQHFEKYSEDGHKLTYFIGNSNIPKFITNLISSVLQLPEVLKISQKNQDEWNFTFNTYATSNKNPSVLSGFDFHKDIKLNGEVSMIYSIGASSNFQIRHPDKIDEVQTIPLRHNSLILLSEESRWDYEHRVASVKMNDEPSLFEDEIESIKRISLVLGLAKAPFIINK